METEKLKNEVVAGIHYLITIAIPLAGLSGIISYYILIPFRMLSPNLFTLFIDFALVCVFRGYDVGSTYYLLKRLKKGREANTCMDKAYDKYGYPNVYIINILSIPIFLIILLYYRGLMAYYFGLYLIITGSFFAGTNNVYRIFKN